MRSPVRKRKARRSDATSRQYTVRAVPAAVDSALRRRARREGKSLNAVVVEALRRGLSLSAEPVVHHDLDFAAGTWVEDAGFDEAQKDFERIDDETCR